jgi:nitrogen regulatory protein PII
MRSHISAAHMKKIEAIVQSLELQQVMDALMNIGIDGMTITDILGDGSEPGRSVTDRSNEDVGDLLPEVRFDLVVSNQRSMEVVDTITQAVHTSQFGLGISLCMRSPTRFALATVRGVTPPYAHPQAKLRLCRSPPSPDQEMIIRTIREMFQTLLAYSIQSEGPLRNERTSCV